MWAKRVCSEEHLVKRLEYKTLAESGKRNTAVSIFTT